MKTAQEIHDDIKSRFEERIQDTIQDNSAADLFICAMAEEFSREYKEIDDNKTPHVWTALSGDTLDKAGVGVNLPREEGESDASYKYRILSWLLIAESSNTSAINAALLNPKKASNIDYVPYIKGAGTGACYVIPKEYEEESITAALEEAADIMSKVASPTLHIEYIVPELRAVRLQILMKTDNGDDSLIKRNLEEDIREYINTIPPKEVLEVGYINKMGINTDDVTYFNVIGMMINGISTSTLDVLQEVDTKFIFDEIVWESEED